MTLFNLESLINTPNCFQSDKSNYIEFILTNKKTFFKNFRTGSFRRAEAVAQRRSVRKGALKNFATFTGKHLYQSLFFNKVAGLSLQLY